MSNERRMPAYRVKAKFADEREQTLPNRDGSTTTGLRRTIGVLVVQRVRLDPAATHGVAQVQATRRVLDLIGLVIPQPLDHEVFGLLLTLGNRLRVILDPFLNGILDVLRELLRVLEEVTHDFLVGHLLPHFLRRTRSGKRLSHGSLLSVS